MKNLWVVFVAILIVTPFGSLLANDKGPGPQGVGATALVAKSHEPHSYNPVRLIKKGNKNTTAYVLKLKKNKSQ